VTLLELIEGLPVRAVGGPDPAGVRVCDVTEDSRTAMPGSLFVARAGHKADGRSFVKEAERAGAVAVLTDDPTLTVAGGRGMALVRCADARLASALIAERFFGDASRKLDLVGVTGTNGKTTNGKTTTTYLIWKMMNAAGIRTGLVGTVIVDDGREVARAAMTTPPAIELSRTLATAREAGVEAAALEVSSHSLDQHRAAALKFRVAVFTNLTRDHLDYHQTMEAYAEAKARLFGLLREDGTAIVNGSDPASERMVRDCALPVVRCFVGKGARGDERTARAEVLDQTLRGMRLRLTGPWGELEAEVGLVGAYNAMNVLQAVASCHVLGLSRAEIGRGLSRVEAPPGRLERVTAPGEDIQVFVDFAHSDDALANVLRAVGSVMEGRGHAGTRVRGSAGGTENAAEGKRLWAVFGCGGDKDRGKRPKMGRAAAEHADRVVVTSDNPRTERPSAIIDEVLSGIAAEDRRRVEVQADRGQAIRHAILAAMPGDVVVIAGKGHETEQILPDGSGGTVSIRFDDREVARATLEERRGAAAEIIERGTDVGTERA